MVPRINANPALSLLCCIALTISLQLCWSEMEGTSLQLECDSSAQNISKNYCDSNKEVEVIGSLISPIVQTSTESHDTFAQNRVFLTNEEMFIDSSISPIVQVSMESHDNSALNRYGNVFKSHLLGCPTVVCMDTELNRCMLMNEGKGLIPGYPQSMVNLMGKWNVASVSGHLHKAMRASILIF